MTLVSTSGASFLSAPRVSTPFFFLVTERMRLSLSCHPQLSVIARVDMSKWRNAKAFCSWLGLCPGNKISGGKVLDRRTCKVINRVATTLRLAAQAVGRSNTCLGIFYRRKKAHLGPAKATTATARKLACLVYHLLKYKDQYREPDPVTYQLKVQKTILNKLQKQAAALGYQLLPTALVPA